MDMMPRIVIAVLAFFLFPYPVPAQSGYEIFEQAVVKERAEGDLEAAITLYERIAADFKTNRPLAAQALLQAAFAYEKMGTVERAEETFRVIASEYSDQTDIVGLARARLDRKFQTDAARGVFVRQVWFGDGADTSGEPSPDGRYLSFVDRDTGDLAVREIATGNVRTLTDKGPWTESSEYAERSIFSPDSRRIAYSWRTEAGRYVLRIIDLDGSSPRSAYEGRGFEHVQPFDWSRDGTHILAVRGRIEGSNELVMISTADGAVRSLYQLDWRYPQQARFSPDTRFVAYDAPQSLGAADRDLYVMQVDGGGARTLIEHPANDFLLGWTPGGDLLFASDRTGSLAAWMIRMRGGQAHGPPSIVRREIGNLIPLGFTGASQFYYGLTTGTANIFHAAFGRDGRDVAGEAAPVTERHPGLNWRSIWSPDGTRIAFRRYLRTPAIVIRDVEAGSEREFVPRLGYYGLMTWAPDGDALIVVGRDSDHRKGVFKFGADTGEVTALMFATAGTTLVGSAQLAGDGRTLLYAERRDGVPGSLRLVRHDLETGTKTPIQSLSHATGWPVPSSDEQFVIYPERRGEDAPRLVLLPLNGGHPQDLVTLPGSLQSDPAWAPDGRHVYFTYRAEEGVSELWRVEVATRVADRTPLPWDNPRFLSIHPNGRDFTFTAGTFDEEIWVMENFLPHE